MATKAKNVGVGPAKKTISKPSVSTPTSRMTAEDKQWQARQDLMTIKGAHEINNDPQRLKAAQKEAAAQVKVLTKVLPK